ncbi:NAD(P)/FAD-dependent oxidoreductase [Geodermatophilaceae bacterium NBWT11]|nr:NAD(P)/FAD-dependent oxidoreductase [Geodermatophilaceae bacterium NBWT11]
MRARPTPTDWPRQVSPSSVAASRARCTASSPWWTSYRPAHRPWTGSPPACATCSTSHPSHRSETPVTETPTPDVDAVVVGAGFAGLYQLHLLRQQGFTTRVFETGAGVGGTWYWNRYPGARCDVESIYYSYSFSPELDQEWTWSERYAAQPEILRYLQHVAERFDLEKDITFSTRVTAAVWDDAARFWQVTTDGGETVTARFVVMASGVLSKAKAPEVPGLDSFSGRVLHTSAWPHEGVDLSGLRVAVIGTGSSGIQAIPRIAEEAGSLTVFQRTPSYAMPAWNRPMEPDEVAQIKSGLVEQRAAQRYTVAGMINTSPEHAALDLDPEEVEATFQRAWDAGGLGSMLSTFTDVAVNPAANELVSDFVRRKIAEIVDDPETAEALTPRAHGLGTKRPCLDTGFYAAFNRPNVDLVDLARHPLESITPAGIRTADGEREFDVIVLATGFDAVTGSLLAVDFQGRDGLRLSEAWSEAPYSLLGLAVAGFPNLFTITGPLSPGILTNIVTTIEHDVEWVTETMLHLREHGIETIEATEQAQREWAEHVTMLSGYTLYPTANSWYLGANVPGKPRVFLAYVAGLASYRRHVEEVVADGYRGFTLGERALSSATA